MSNKTATQVREKDSAISRKSRPEARSSSRRREQVNNSYSFARAMNAPTQQPSPEDILELQRTLGNRTVLQILAQRRQNHESRLTIQASLAQGPADGSYEPEAGFLARPVANANPAPEGTQVIQRQPDEEEEKRKKETKGPSDPTSGFEFESTSHNIGPPAHAQPQNQLAPFDLPHTEGAHNEGALEIVTGLTAAEHGIPDIAKLIALIKELMLAKTQKK